MLLASSGYWLEMLLNISQYTGQSPTTKKSPAQNVSSAVAEKPWHKSKAWASESWSGAMNTCVHVFFFFVPVFGSFGIYLGVKLISHILCSNF